MDLSFYDHYPVLETPRLRLRELQTDDAAALFEIFRLDQVTAHYDIETMTELARAESLVGLIRRRFADRAGIRWALTDKEKGDLVGTIGINSITVPSHRAVIGYELAPRVWGRGLATEAVRAVVRFGHEQVGLNRIEATVMLGNDASARVLQKVGFTEEGVLRAYGYWKGHYHDLRMFSILRDS